MVQKCDWCRCLYVTSYPNPLFFDENPEGEIAFSLTKQNGEKINIT